MDSINPLKRKLNHGIIIHLTLAKCLIMRDNNPFFSGLNTLFPLRYCV